MNKRACVVIFALVFVVFFSCFHTLSSADTMSDFYSSAKMISGYNPTWSQQDFLSKIQYICSQGAEPINKDNKVLNPYIYEHYDNLVVYGLPHGDFFPTKNGRTFKDGIQGEYKFLGFALEGFIITNDYWHNPNWTGTGKFTTYKEVNYKDIPGAEASWNALHPLQVEHMLNKPFWDDDYIIPGQTPYTLLDIFDNNIEVIKRKVLVQVPPGVWRTASFRLEY